MPSEDASVLIIHQYNQHIVCIGNPSKILLESTLLNRHTKKKKKNTLTL